MPMSRYKLVRIRPIDTLLLKADIEGFFQAIDPYLISKDPHIVEGDANVIEALREIGKKHRVQSQWEELPLQ